MMDESSTTVAADNQGDQSTPDPTDATTDAQNGADSTDNLDSSQSDATSTDDDKSASTDSSDTTPASQFDRDLDTWAEKTGREKPTNDQERSLLQEIRDGQRDYSRKQANINKMQAVVKGSRPDGDTVDEGDDDTEDPLEKEVKSLNEKFKESENTRLRSEFFVSNEVSTEEGDVMADIFKEKVDKGGKRAFEFWADPESLEDLLVLAKARLAGETDTSQITDEAARKERERIAKEQKAAGPNRSASSTTTTDKTEEEQRLERFKNW